MTRTPVVGIVVGHQPDRHHLFPGYPRHMVNEDYARSVATAGGAPLLVPLGERLDHLTAQLGALDGVLLTGGDDVAPALFGQETQRLCGPVRPDRDAFELAVVAHARAARLPLLGICRGMQVLNVALGGTLHQHLGEELTALQHQAPDGPDVPVHAVSIAEGSRLAAWSGVTRARVNSFHHQAVDRLGEGLRAVAHAPDGVVEAVEADGPSLLAGVQWHPEMMTGSDPVAQAIFRGLVEACAGGRPG